MHNQLTVLRRYARFKNVDINCSEIQILEYRDKVSEASSISQIMGYEGIAAKAYFKGMNQCNDPEFAFNGRSRRPPLDEFNSRFALHKPRFL